MTPAEEYEFCISKVGINPDLYFTLTTAETYSIVQGWLWRNERTSADFRELYALQFNQFAKSKKTASQLWPLKLIDSRFSMFKSADEEYAWREKMIKWAESRKLLA